MKIYQIIYCDPPWQYDFSKSDSRKIENQYPTLSLQEIKNLRYDWDFEFAKNAVMYMWATAPKLKEALDLMATWDFEYKTHAIWDKEIMGMGYWFRGQHELLLVGVRGSYSPPDAKIRIGSVIKYRRTIHSKKPAVVRELIKQWYPTENKIELFAREKTEGWDVWGNEVKSDIELKV
jgi:N6-adenosine-specific RNA methylase IME4